MVSLPLPRPPLAAPAVLLLALCGCRDLDGDGHRGAADCDPLSGDVNPSQQEIPYNGADDDCDPTTPDDDLDGDGWGVAWDCDEADPEIHPDAEEVCDGADNDCSGRVDDGVGELWYVDEDGDGWGAAEVQSCDGGRYVDRGGDCDDASMETHPEADEPCDAVDNDCDDAVDEDEARWGEQSSCPAESCGALYEARGEGSDGVWWLDPGALGEPFEARCQEGWTLLGSFVNDDGADWGVSDWTAESSFGEAASADLTDHRSPATWRLEVTDLRAEDDEGGWLLWEGALEGTLAAALAGADCAESPQEVSAVSSSNPDAAGALLTFWGVDPETGTCALDDAPADAAVLGAFHDGCGAWGFGQRTSDGSWADHAFCLADELPEEGECGDWLGYAGLPPPTAERCGAAYLWAR